MSTEKTSQENIRKKKFLLILPLLAIPFITLAFWALGGGSGSLTVSNNKADTGLNLNLPEANVDGKQMPDKLGFYEQSDKSAGNFKKWMEQDSYYRLNLDTDSSHAKSKIPEFNTGSYNYQDVNDPNEKKVYEKLHQLNQQLEQSTLKDKQVAISSYDPYTPEEAYNNMELDRLENMMNTMSETDSSDPELNQLQSMMDKILDIQHPDRVRERLKERSKVNSQQVYPVTTDAMPGNISLLDTLPEKQTSQASFFGLNDADHGEYADNAIEAVIHETKTLVTGAVVKFRLLRDIYVNGVWVPKDQFLFGVANLNNERLQIEIHSIRYGNALFPVKLEVFDMDGLAGIYVPGAINRDVMKQSADNSLQTLEMTSLDPSLKAQATAAGVSTVKSLLSRKVKLVRVTIKAGYQVLLKNKNL